MYIGFFNYHQYYNKNRMLTSPSSPIGDDLMHPFVCLARELEKLGHKTATIDTDALKKFDAVVFVEFPTLKNKYFKQLLKNKFQNLYLIALESPIIKPDNYNKKNHEYFKKIFTWEDSFIDNKKYFKINCSYFPPPPETPENLNSDFQKSKKLCALIAGNKFTPHPKELYTERQRAIRWFEKNHPNEFDLFGVGWDKYYFQGKFLGVNLARLNRLKMLAKLLGPNYPSYRGGVKSKKDTYKNYKFSICYENCGGFMGYITEKIFDCFSGGCVPIYLGAANITEHVPKNTFIDKRSFKTYDELYSYIKNMPDGEYGEYLNAINIFFKSEKAYPFSSEYFAKTISREVLK